MRADGQPQGATTVVIAEFEVEAAARAEFLALAHAFAARCRADEPGCRRFDVVQLESPAPGVLFYEAYADDDAFEAHRQAAHLSRFQTAFAALPVRERALRRGHS